MNRREYLTASGSVAITAVAGCSSASGAKLNQAGQNAIKFTNRSKGHLEGKGTLKKGEFGGIQLSYPVKFHVDWSLKVTSGKGLDVWMIEKPQLAKFRDEKDITYSRSLSKFGISGKTSGSGRVESGKWRLIFENSSAYKTEPSGTVKFDFSASTKSV